MAKKEPWLARPVHKSTLLAIQMRRYMTAKPIQIPLQRVITSV